MVKISPKSDRQSPLPKTGFLPILMLLLLGLVFLGQSYALYNINHFKLAAALIGCAIFLSAGIAGQLRGAARKVVPPVNPDSGISYTAFLLLLLPLGATLPGLLITQGEYAYFFPAEFASWLVCCCWLFLTVNSFDYEKHFSFLIRGLAVLVCIASLLALANTTALSEDFVLDVLDRESGTFGNPNYLAAYLVLQIPLLLICCLPVVRHNLQPASAGKWRLLFVVTVLLATGALVLTQARAAQLTLLVCLMLLCGMMARWPVLFGVSRRLLLAVICSVIMLGLAALVFLPVIDYIIERARYGSTLSSRLVPWRAAWQSIQDSPWYGWGSGSSYSLFFQYADAGSRIDWFQRRYPHAHNEYLEIWQEGGLLALTAFLALTAYLIRSIYKLFKSPNVNAQGKLYLSGISLGIFAYYLLATVSVAPRMISVRLIFFLLLAMMLLIQKSATGSTSSIATGQSGPWLSRPMPIHTLQTSVLILLLVSASAYFSDASSRYRYVRILQEREGPAQLRELRALRDSNPNVYAMVNLIEQELLLGDIDSARISIGVMNKLIPHYDNVGYLEAVAAILTDDLSGARELAERYQQRDRYHIKTALLLGKIALLQRDSTLFMQQLNLALTARLMQDPDFGKIAFEQLTTRIENNRINVRQMPTTTETYPLLVIAEPALSRIISQGRVALQQPGDTAQLEQYLLLVRNKIAETSYPELSELQLNSLQRQLSELFRDIVVASI